MDDEDEIDEEKEPELECYVYAEVEWFNGSKASFYCSYEEFCSSLSSDIHRHSDVKTIKVDVFKPIEESV